MTIVRPLRYMPVSPWEGFRRLHEELNDFVYDALREVSSGSPPLNVWYNEERAVIEAELPGVVKEDLDLEVVGNSVTIKGQRKRQNGKGPVLREERDYGSFGRTIQLPFDVNAEGVQASLQRGVLTLTLPRREEDKPKKVQISAS